MKTKTDQRWWLVAEQSASPLFTSSFVCLIHHFIILRSQVVFIFATMTSFVSRSSINAPVVGMQIALLLSKRSPPLLPRRSGSCPELKCCVVVPTKCKTICGDYSLYSFAFHRPRSTAAPFAVVCILNHLPRRTKHVGKNTQSSRRNSLKDLFVELWIGEVLTWQERYAIFVSRRWGGRRCNEERGSSTFAQTPLFVLLWGLRFVSMLMQFFVFNNLIMQASSRAYQTAMIAQITTLSNHITITIYLWFIQHWSSINKFAVILIIYLFKFKKNKTIVVIF